MVKIASREGDLLDASFSLENVRGEYRIAFESRGPDRNVDYTEGLRTLLGRLGEINAVLADAFLDTQATQREGLSQSERQLALSPDLDYPLALADIDPDAIATRLKRAQLSIGQQAGAAGGNQTRRMVMVVHPGEQPFPNFLEAFLGGAPRIGVVYVPSRPRSAENLRIGLEWGVWGFNDDAMQRSNYFQEFESLRTGDLVFLGHGGPSPRVPEGGWSEARVQVGHLGAINAIDIGDRRTIWPDDVYPYRLHIDFAGEYSGFDASQVGAEIMEALRLSANQQGRVVVVPLTEILLTNGSGYSSPLALDGPLDNLIQGTRRREQSKLRHLRLGTTSAASCDLCGRDLPVRYLRMAHIKQRALCSHDEKLDPHVVMSACIECDAFFETNELVVDDEGVVRALPQPDATPELEAALASRHGHRCAAFSDRTRAYFAFHRS